MVKKWNGNGNGNAYDRGDYNSSFALRAVELKSRFSHNEAHIETGGIKLCTDLAELKIDIILVIPFHVPNHLVVAPHPGGPTHC